MKQYTNCLIASLGLAAFFGSPSGRAAVTNLNVIADTFINAGHPDNNDGANAWFDAGTDGVGGVRRGLFRFDLSGLAPEDLRRVTRWVEDRMINAVTPLYVRLQRERPGTLRADRTLQAAVTAVRKVLAGVEELRTLQRRMR